MKLFARCQSCKEDILLKKTYFSRPDLISELGEYFNLTCSKCTNEKEYHANDVRAEDSYSINLLGSIVGIIVIIFTTMFLWDQGFISNVGFLIGGAIIAASNLSSLKSNSNAFNKYKVRRSKKK